MPSLYLYVFSFPWRKKRLPDHSFLKLIIGYVNQTHADYFTCTIVSISIVPWFTGAIEWSLGVITPSVFMTAIICSVALIYVWKINPVKINGAGTRKDKHKRCKSALSVALEEFHKMVVWSLIMNEYASTANVTINTFLFWNSLPSCFASIRKDLHIFNFGF